MSASVERCDLGPGLTVPRVITGMWQIADMEREGRSLDLDAAADAMERYVNAGLTAFDMADHYGSAEDIAGKLSRRADPSRVQLFTKWVPTGRCSKSAYRRMCGSLHMARSPAGF